MLMRKVQCRELSEFFYGCFIVSTGSGFRRLEASYVSTGIAAATKSHGEPASVVKNAAKPGFVWVMHPDMAASVVPKVKEWERDPVFSAEYERIMAVKREEWRDREANRKLVD